MLGKNLGVRSVNWPRLLFRYTDPKAKEHLVSLQSKFSEVSSLYASVPKSVDAIDWSQWQKNIRTPGIVAELKAHYDKEMSKVVKVNTVELDTKKKAQENEIRQLESNQGESAEFLKDLRSELDYWQSLYNYENVFVWINDVHSDWRNFPTHRYKKQAYKLGWTPTRQVSKRWKLRAFHTVWRNLDLKELRKQLAAGNTHATNPFYVTWERVPRHLYWYVPFDKKWFGQAPAAWSEVSANPQNSIIYRAFQLRQITGKVDA